MNHAVLAVTLCAFLVQADASLAKAQRSSAATSAFKRHSACPANGARAGKCPGYVVDHIRPLCAGGPDTPANMQWQTLADSKIKDREENRECRALRRLAVK